MTGLLDDYLLDPRLSLLDKTRIQAQVLVPVLRALRAELGKDRADAAAGPARLVAAAVRCHRRRHRGQPAAQMGGDAGRLERCLGA